MMEMAGPPPPKKKKKMEIKFIRKINLSNDGNRRTFSIISYLKAPLSVLYVYYRKQVIMHGSWS